MTIVATSYMSIVYQWTATVNHFLATCIILWVSPWGTRKIESFVVLNSLMPHKRVLSSWTQTWQHAISQQGDTGRRDVGTSWDEIYRYQVPIVNKIWSGDIACASANMILLSVWRLIRRGLNSKRRVISAYISRWLIEHVPHTDRWSSGETNWNTLYSWAIWDF